MSNDASGFTATAIGTTQREIDAEDRQADGLRLLIAELEATHKIAKARFAKVEAALRDVVSEYKAARAHTLEASHKIADARFAEVEAALRDLVSPPRPQNLTLISGVVPPATKTHSGLAPRRLLQLPQAMAKSATAWPSRYSNGGK